jgi:hypothetical protein
MRSAPSANALTIETTHVDPAYFRDHDGFSPGQPAITHQA